MMQLLQRLRVVFTGKLGEGDIECLTLSSHYVKEVIACHKQ